MKVVIPTKQSEVTLDKYQKWLKIINDTEDNKERYFRVTALFSEQDGDLTNVSLRKLKEITKQVEDVMLEVPQKVQYKFDFKGQRYGLIPNLSEMTTQEFGDAHEMSQPENLHYLMQVLYRPIVREYDKFYNIEPYEANEQRAELFRQLPLSIFKGAIVFFSTIVLTYWKETQNYSPLPSDQSMK